MTNLVLRGGNLRALPEGARGGAACAEQRQAAALAPALAKDDNGRFRTHGRDSVATDARDGLADRRIAARAP